MHVTNMVPVYPGKVVSNFNLGVNIRDWYLQALCGPGAIPPYPVTSLPSSLSFSILALV